MKRTIVFMFLLFVLATYNSNASACKLTCYSGNNILCNGDFEEGNVGFSSEYSVSTTLSTSGTYNVDDDVPSGFIDTEDHTTGTGNMLLVNGSSTISSKPIVWSEIVNVLKNQQYTFEAWVTALSNKNAPILEILINNQKIKSFYFSKKTWTKNDWIKLTLNWNSQNNNVATISILDANRKANGNDFALDDLSFKQKICGVYPVPEPTSMLLGLISLIGLAFKQFKR